MSKFKKTFVFMFVFTIFASITIVVNADSGTSYANRFVSNLSDGYYRCYYQFIPAHKVTKGEPYCSATGKHLKQAWVRAYNSSFSTGKKYSRKASSTKDKSTIKTPTASIPNNPFTTEYTSYNYSTF